jgi:hypothetical protein
MTSSYILKSARRPSPGAYAFPKEFAATAERTGGLESAASPDVRPFEDVDAETAMCNIFAELRDAEAKSDRKVLMAPHDGRWAGPAARFQSLTASGEIKEVKYEPVVSGGLEAQYDTSDWTGWASTVWEKIKHLKPHDIVRPTTTTADPFPNEASIAVISDWGTGMYGALEIKNTLLRKSVTFDMLIHLGDIYYSGTHDEVKANILAHWPKQERSIAPSIPTTECIPDVLRILMNPPGIWSDVKLLRIPE